MRNTIVFFAILFIAACSPYKVTTTQSDTVNFAAYSTFKFEDDDDQAAQALSEYQKAIAIVKDEVKDQLEKEGLTETKDAELAVNIGATVQEKEQTRQTTIQEAPHYIGQRRYHWESKKVVVGKYEEGSVTVAIGDTKKDKLVWEGTVSRVLRDNKPLSEEEIRQGIQKLFQKFP